MQQLNKGATNSLRREREEREREQRRSFCAENPGATLLFLPHRERATLSSFPPHRRDK